jgi:hypothetical protein
MMDRCRGLSQCWLKTHTNPSSSSHTHPPSAVGSRSCRTYTSRTDAHGSITATGEGARVEGLLLMLMAVWVGLYGLAVVQTGKAPLAGASAGAGTCSRTLFSRPVRLLGGRRSCCVDDAAVQQPLQRRSKITRGSSAHQHTWCSLALSVHLSPCAALLAGRSASSGSLSSTPTSSCGSAGTSTCPRTTPNP